MADDDTDDTEAIYPDPFSVALQLCQIAAKPATYATALKKLRKVGRDIEAAERKLTSLQAEAAGIVEAAQAQVKAIHDEAQRRADAAAIAEEELVEREQKIARLESAWRNLGEPETVLSGFQAPELSPLQKARRAHGMPLGRAPDPLFSSAPDAAGVDIDADALMRRDVGDARSDAQGNVFAPSTLTRSTEHKRAP